MLTPVQKLVGNLGWDAWRRAWVHERRGYHGRWVDSGHFIRQGDWVVHARTGVRARVVGWRAGRGRDGGQIRVRTSGDDRTLEWSPHSTRFMFSYPHGTATGQIRGSGLTPIDRQEDEADNALRWHVLDPVNPAPGDVVSPRLATAIGEPVDRWADVGNLGEGERLVQGRSGRRYFVEGDTVMDEGAPHNIGQITDPESLDWRNEGGAAGIPERSTRMARVGDVNGHSAFLVEGASGSRYLTHPRFDERYPHWTIEDARYQSAPGASGHSTELRVGEPAYDLHNQLLGMVDSINHSDRRDPATGDRRYLVNVRTPGGELLPYWNSRLRHGMPQDHTGRELRVGDRVYHRGSGMRGSVTGLLSNGNVNVHSDNRNAIGEVPAAPEMLVHDDYSAAHPAPAETETPAVAAAPEVNRMPGYELRIGDRVAHSAGRDRQGRERVGTVFGWRRMARGNPRIRVRLDDGREAQWDPAQTRYHDQPDPNGNGHIFTGPQPPRIRESLSHDGEIAAMGEPAAGPSRSADRRTAREPAPAALPFRAPVGNRDFGVELEWKQRNGATREAVGARMTRKLREHFPRPLANLVDHRKAEVEGYNHSSKPWWKIVTDATEYPLFGELVSPIMGGTRDHFNYDAGAGHISGEEGMAHIHDAMESVREENGVVGSNTSFHVSLGVHDLRNTPDEGLAAIRDIFRFYHLNFRNIEQLLPTRRRGTMWATDASSWRMEDIESAQSAYDLASGASHTDAVNLSHIMDRGTIEFRSLGGTLDDAHARAWIEVLTSIMQAAKDGRLHDGINYDSPEAMLRGLEERGQLPADNVAWFTRWVNRHQPRAGGGTGGTGRPSADMLRRFRMGSTFGRAADINVGDTVRLRGYLRQITRIEQTGRGNIRVFYNLASGQERSGVYYSWSTIRIYHGALLGA